MERSKRGVLCIVVCWDLRTNLALQNIRSVVGGIFSVVKVLVSYVEGDNGNELFCCKSNAKP